MGPLEGGLKWGTILRARWETPDARGIFYLFIVGLRIWDKFLLWAYVTGMRKGLVLCHRGKTLHVGRWALFFERNRLRRKLSINPISDLLHN